MLNDQLHLGMGNLFGSIALQSAYQNGDAWLGQMLDYVWGNVAFVDDFLKTNVPQIKACMPESTYMIWLDCRELALKGDDLKNFFIKDAKAGFNDGRVFGTGGEGFMRINVACPRAIVGRVLLLVHEAVSRL
jgi:cystathionine beta-lyase